MTRIKKPLSFIAATAAIATMATVPLSHAAPESSSTPLISEVTFTSGGEKIAGRLYVPASVSAKRPAPGLVVTGAWMTVKEQMAARYAQEMAKRGFVTLIFDFRGWGESGGSRRQMENPQEKVADIGAAVAFLRTRPEVAGQRLGGLGICASSGYMVTAATQTKELQSLALVAPWLHDRKIVDATYGDAEGVAKLIKAGREAEVSYQQRKKQAFVPAASLTDKSAIMFGVPYYTDPDRGMIPAWRNEADPAFWEGWLSFDAMPPAPRLTQPFFMVHSEAAAIPQGAHQFYAAVKAPKGELWLDNVPQFDFYDRPAPIKTSSDAVAMHFRKTMMNDADKDAVQNDALNGVREFFAALEAADIPRFLKVWAEDGVQEMPYAPGAFPKRLEGRAAIEKQYGPLPTAFTGMRFPLRRLVATEEPGVVLAEYDGSIGLKSGGRYDNRYIGIFTFNADGKLAHFREYFDPYTLTNGFPGAKEAAMPNDERIRAAVVEIARAADAKDWQSIRALFADEVDFDYTSVAGGKPARLKADDIVTGWRQGLGRYRETKHNFSDIAVKIDGDKATSTFSGQATHLRDADGKAARWSCGGDYTYSFTRTPQGWKATAAKFDMKWEQGER